MTPSAIRLEEILAAKKKILLVGETWISSATHIKGFDQFYSASYHSGADPLAKAMEDSAYELHHMAAHDCATAFPQTLEELDQYDAVLLSDIGANTILLPPDVWLHGSPRPNRLKLLREWTYRGGGLIMAGGYLSFQGIDGKARWRMTPVDDALPVACLPYDDRIEVPEGFHAVVLNENHPILRGVTGIWPLLLGANEVTIRDRDDCIVLAALPMSEGGHPLLAVGEWGNGRTVAWTSDIGPHWAPAAFVDWPGYKTLWLNVFDWVTRCVTPE